MIKAIFRYIKLFITDVITDIQFIFHAIKKIIKKEPILDPVKVEIVKQEFKNYTVKQFFKDSYPIILVAVACIFMGIALSGKYWEVQCNNFIIETYIKPQMELAKGNFSVVMNQ